MFNNLVSNLSKSQKVVIVVILQIVFIAIIGSVLQFCLMPHQHASIESSEIEKEVDMPADAKDFVSSSIWSLVSSYVSDLNSNDVDDIVIREGSFEAVENDDGSVSVNFIVDIDSLKQTYTVSTGWT